MIIIFNIAALSYCRPMGEGNIGLWTLLGPNPNDIILGIHPLRNFFSRPSPYPRPQLYGPLGCEKKKKGRRRNRGRRRRVLQIKQTVKIV